MFNVKFISALIFVILIAIITRAYTFIFPHDHGDQIIYAALAQNISAGEPYNLLSTKIVRTNITGYSFLTYKPCNTNSPVSISALFKKSGVDLYSEKLLYRTPLLPFLIQSAKNACRSFSTTSQVICNQQLVPSGKPLVEILSFEIPQMRRVKFRDKFFTSWFKKHSLKNLIFIAKKQLPVTLPPFLGSLLLIIGTMVLARQFSNTAALWAGLIMVFCPIDIFCASRVLTDSIMTAGIIWCFIFVNEACKKNKQKILFLLMAVIALLVAVYSKESSALILFTGFAVIAYKNENKKAYFTMAIIAAISIIPWIIALHIINGQGLSNTYADSPFTASWYKMTMHRGLFFYFYKPVLLYPVLILSIIYFITVVRKKLWWQNPFLVFPSVTIIILTALLAVDLLHGSEYRQILPAIPFLAVASAYSLEFLREKINQKFQPAAGVIIVLFIILISAFYAFQKSSPSLLGNAGDIFLITKSL